MRRDRSVGPQKAAPCSFFELQRPPLVGRRHWDAAVALVLRALLPPRQPLPADCDAVLLHAVETCGPRTVAELLRRGARFAHAAERALGEADAATIRCIAAAGSVRCAQGYLYCCKDAPPAEVFERLAALVECFGPPSPPMVSRCAAVVRARLEYCVEKTQLRRALSLLLGELRDDNDAR